MMMIEINTQFNNTQQNRQKLYSLAAEEDIRTLGNNVNRHPEFCAI
jgi:hypothetical protein